MNGSIDISVIMATYNPSWDKCLFTLDSIIAQKDISLELIVADDGSSDNLFTKFEDYFKSHGFTDYKLVAHVKNQGTVKNYFDGLKNATGKFIKLISPGDALYNETTLAEWLKFINASGRLWSFAEAVFYLNEDDQRKIVSVPALPRVIECYLNGDDETCRWNYVVLEDVALGAALMSDRELLLKYLEKVTDVSIYAEDVAFAAMMYDGILPAYYDKDVIFYEFGTGVSTGEKKWLLKIHEDQRNAEKILSERTDGDEFQKKMSQALTSVNSGSDTKKKVSRNLQKGGIKKVIKHRLNPRMSSAEIASCGQWWTDYINRS